MAVYSLNGIKPNFINKSSCFIANSADIIGSVDIAEHVGIWFGAILRGDTETLKIGKGSNVQDGSVMHADHGFPASIGEGCTIGHKAIIHGCRIEDNSLVGMGATVLNGATIGENCLIGAGSLVSEGKKIAKGSLVIGMPGKVKRMLSADEIKALYKSAEYYQENAKKYIQNLKIEVV